jgi:hypothetical protein
VRKTLLTATASLALLAGLAQPSHASLILSISDGTTTQTVTDPSSTGMAMFNNALGIFTTNVATALSTPIIGSIFQPIIDLNSIDVANRSSSGGTLTITETDTGFFGVGGIARFLNSIGGTLNNGSMNINTYLGCGNQTIHLTSQSFDSGAFSGSASTDVAACNGSYSLTQVETINLSAGGFYSGDSTLAVPEPSTLASFGAGLALLFGFGWLRRHGTMV